LDSDDDDDDDAKEGNDVSPDVMKSPRDAGIRTNVKMAAEQMTTVDVTTGVMMSSIHQSQLVSRSSSGQLRIRLITLIWGQRI